MSKRIGQVDFTVIKMATVLNTNAVDSYEGSTQAVNVHRVICNRVEKIVKNILLAVLVLASSVALAAAPSANITTALYAASNFTNTSGSHTAFVYNTSANFGKTFFSGGTDGFLMSASPSRNAALGWFANGVSCALCATTGSNPNPGIQTLSALSFDEQIGHNNFAANGGGYLVVADGASKGAPATAAPVTTTTEPKTYALMLAGLGLMGFVANRRRQQDV